MGDVGMTDVPALEGALARLEAAIGRLEGAVERRNRAEQGMRGLRDQIQRLGEDRSRLAGELDTQKSHSNTLEEANREVSRRLVSAMESIRTVLDAHGG